MLKVIETEYNGIRFRSRTEARWAVFLDIMGIPYLYEPEAFRLGDMSYLPDFFLPDLDVYFEVKPSNPTDEETEKAHRLSDFTQKKVFIMRGTPEIPSFDFNWYKTSYADIHHSSFVLEPNGETIFRRGWDTGYIWCECPKCKLAGIEFDGRTQRLPCQCLITDKFPQFFSGRFFHGDKGYNFDSPKLVLAYNKARSYRFEPAALCKS